MSRQFPLTASPPPAGAATPMAVPAPPTSSEAAAWTDEPHTPMRRAIARRLTESKARVPHFYLTADCRVDDLRPFRFKFSAGPFAGLLDGSADLFITQTAGSSVRLGAPTLTINYDVASVPEPGFLTLLAGGLVALIAGKMRRV